MAKDTTDQMEQLQALLVKARAGDNRAYAQFLQGITPVINASITASLNPSQRDDVVQEVLLSVHRALPTYDAKRPLKPWLQAIINYRKLDYLRQLYARKVEYPADLEADFANKLVTEPGSAGEMKDIRRGLERLSPKQRRVLELLRIQGHSVDETAQIMRISPADVKVSAHRAATKLKEILDG